MTPKKKNSDITEEKVEKSVEVVEEPVVEEVKEETPEVIETPKETVEEPVKDDLDLDEEEMDAEDESLTLIEKFVRFETETKIGLVSTLIILIALIFRWDWINTTWWLVLIIGAIGVKTLYTQMSDLKEDKPGEAKIARLSFITMMVLLVIRDLYITSRLDDFMDILHK